MVVPFFTQQTVLAYTLKIIGLGDLSMLDIWKKSVRLCGKPSVISLTVIAGFTFLFFFLLLLNVFFA